MKNTRETFFRNKELKEFQKEITDLIQYERAKNEHAHFKHEVDVSELTSADMGMYRYTQELERKGFDIDSLVKLKKEMAFFRRYMHEARISKNNSRDVFIQWMANNVQGIFLRIEDALRRLPLFKEQMKKIIQGELRKKRLKKEYEQSFNDSIDVEELLPAGMLIYEWTQSLKNMPTEKAANMTQTDFEKYRAHYFQYFNQVPKSNTSRRTFVHYVGNLVTATLSELELRVMYPEDFQKV